MIQSDKMLDVRRLRKTSGAGLMMHEMLDSTCDLPAMILSVASFLPEPLAIH